MSFSSTSELDHVLASTFCYQKNATQRKCLERREWCFERRENILACTALHDVLLRALADLHFKHLSEEPGH